MSGEGEGEERREEKREKLTWIGGLSLERVDCG